MKRLLLATLILGLSTTGFAGIRETIEYENTVLHKKTDRFTDEVWFDTVTGEGFVFKCRNSDIVVWAHRVIFYDAVQSKIVLEQLRSPGDTKIINRIRNHQEIAFRFRVVDFPPSSMLNYDVDSSKLHPEHADLLIFQLLKADRNRSSYPDGIKVLIETIFMDDSQRTSYDLTGISESLPQLDCFGIMR